MVIGIKEDYENSLSVPQNLDKVLQGMEISAIQGEKSLLMGITKRTKEVNLLNSRPRSC